MIADNSWLTTNIYYYVGGAALLAIITIIILLKRYRQQEKNHYDRNDQEISGTMKIGTELNKFISSGEAGIEALQGSFQQWSNIDVELARTCQEKIDEINTAIQHLEKWKAVAEQGIIALEEQKEETQNTLSRITYKK